MDGAANPDISAFGFPAYLGLPQEIVVISNMLMTEEMAERNVVVDVYEDSLHRASGSPFPAID